jgi:PIN domain nuclease of toxin-antitoxin system
MSRLLPDTQMLLWAARDPNRLGPVAADLLEDSGNRVYFSLVSIWETAIKFALGREDFNMPPRVLRETLLGLGFVELPIASEHVIAVSTLPLFHRDPFDRLLVAQAEFEGLTLMTTDKKLAQYGPHVQRFK